MSIDVVVIQPPAVTVSNDTTINMGDIVQLLASGAILYNWEPANQLSCFDCADPIAAPNETIEYCVTGWENNCADTACVLINVLINCGEVYVPSAFSPNDDGENDYLCVYGNCFEKLTFKIYNRWGEVVFESSETGICWDGNWKGKKLNSAVFVYLLDGVLITGENIEKKGNISLIR